MRRAQTSATISSAQMAKASLAATSTLLSRDKRTQAPQEGQGGRKGRRAHVYGDAALQTHMNAGGIGAPIRDVAATQAIYSHAGITTGALRLRRMYASNALLRMGRWNTAHAPDRALPLPCAGGTRGCPPQALGGRGRAGLHARWRVGSHLRARILRLRQHMRGARSFSALACCARGTNRKTREKRRKTWAERRRLAFRANARRGVTYARLPTSRLAPRYFRLPTLCYFPWRAFCPARCARTRSRLYAASTCLPAFAPPDAMALSPPPPLWPLLLPACLDRTSSHSF